MKTRLRDRWGKESSEGAKAHWKYVINRSHGREGEGLEAQKIFQSEDGGSWGTGGQEVNIVHIRGRKQRKTREYMPLILINGTYWWRSGTTRSIGRGRNWY